MVDRAVVALHDGGHRERHAGELDEAGRGAFRLEREHPHLGRVAVLAGERLQQLVLGHAGRGVEEVEDLRKGEDESVRDLNESGIELATNLARWLDAIFAGLGQ